VWASALSFSLSTNASSQFWEEAGLPMYNPSPELVFTDTLHDWLLAAGQLPIVIEDTSFIPLFRYDGTDWDTMGLFGSTVEAAVIYHDTLIVAGGFSYISGNVNIKKVACYANGSWHPYGVMGNSLNSGHVERLRVIDGVLYAVGIFEFADGQLCNGLAQRVGGHWEPVPGWSDFSFNSPPWLGDIIRFQGKLVIGGAFSTVGFTLRDLVQFDGSAWMPICDGCLNGGMDGVSALAEYQGSLYVGGIFFYATGNAGQGIMRWDGLNWYALGQQGDVLQNINYSDQYSPDIHELVVRDSLLYISGAFLFVDHVPTPAGICAWDGTDFCLLEGEPFSDTFAPIAFYHDTLYGGSSFSADPELRGVIRYLGELCTYTVGVGEHAAPADGLPFNWSANGELVLMDLSDGPHRLAIYDAQGRVVLERKVSSTAGRSEAVLFTEHSAALYVVVVDQARTGKLVPIR
jgi:hypothetical protein